MTKQRLLAFARAWSTKNVDQVMLFFTEDCIYRPSVLEGEKEKFVGKPEVTQAIERMMLFDDSQSSKVSNLRVVDEFGFWEWEYLTKENKRISGCDMFKFRNESIIEKNAFRKIDIS